MHLFSDHGSVSRVAGSGSTGIGYLSAEPGGGTSQPPARRVRARGSRPVQPAGGVPVGTGCRHRSVAHLFEPMGARSVGPAGLGRQQLGPRRLVGQRAPGLRRQPVDPGRRGRHLALRSRGARRPERESRPELRRQRGLHLQLGGPASTHGGRAPGDDAAPLRLRPSGSFVEDLRDRQRGARRSDRAAGEQRDANRPGRHRRSGDLAHLGPERRPGSARRPGGPDQARLATGRPGHG